MFNQGPPVLLPRYCDVRGIQLTIKRIKINIYYCKQDIFSIFVSYSLYKYCESLSKHEFSTDN